MTLSAPKNEISADSYYTNNSRVKLIGSSSIVIPETCAGRSYVLSTTLNESSSRISPHTVC
jgi:hypothetical protein